MSHKHFVVSLNPSLLQDKRYDLLALFAAYESTYIDSNKNIFVDIKYCKKKLGQDFNFSKYKKQLAINNLIELGALEKQEQDENYKIALTKTPFIKLKYGVAKFCASHLTSNEFKAYCFLLSKYYAKINYGFDSHYYFSEKQLLEAIGYCGVAQKNVQLMTSTLIKLKELGLINYSEQSFPKPGAQGTYHALYSITDVPPQTFEETERSSRPKRKKRRTKESLFLCDVPPAVPVEFCNK